MQRRLQSADSSNTRRLAVRRGPAKMSRASRSGTKAPLRLLVARRPTTIHAVSDPGEILVLLLGFPVGLGLLLAVLSLLEDDLFAAPATRDKAEATAEPVSSVEANAPS